MRDEGLVFIVDDDPVSLLPATRALVDQGYRVLSATGGESGLPAIHAEQPDLLLLDLRLEGMDGFGVCRRLKGSPDTRDTPVIFLTGVNDGDSLAQGFAVGAVDYD